MKIMATPVTSHLPIFLNNIYMQYQIPTNKINVRFKCTSIQFQSISIVKPIYVNLKIYLCLFPNCNNYGAEQMIFLQLISINGFFPMEKTWRDSFFGENVGGGKVMCFGYTAQSSRLRGFLANSMKKILTKDPQGPRSLAQRVELYNQSTLLYHAQHILLPISMGKNSSLEFCWSFIFTRTFV